MSMRMSMSMSTSIGMGLIHAVWGRWILRWVAGERGASGMTLLSFECSRLKNGIADLETLHLVFRSRSRFGVKSSAEPNLRDWRDFLSCVAYAHVV